MPKTFGSIDGGILFFVGLLGLVLIILTIEFNVLDLGYFVLLFICFLYYLHIDKN